MKERERERERDNDSKKKKSEFSIDGNNNCLVSLESSSASITQLTICY